MTPDRTAAAIAARRRATEAKLQRVRDHVASRKRRKPRVPYPAVARQAGVSRTFLYANPDARALISDAVSKPGGPKAAAHEGSGDHDLPLRERALNAEAALTAAHAEITAQRHRMAILLGQVRDLEHDLSPQAAQRLASENTTLKHHVHQLTRDNNTPDDRLEAARPHNRFAARRLAPLEAPLTPPRPPHP